MAESYTKWWEYKRISSTCDKPLTFIKKHFIYLFLMEKVVLSQLESYKK